LTVGCKWNQATHWDGDISSVDGENGKLMVGEGEIEEKNRQYSSWGEHAVIDLNCSILNQWLRVFKVNSLIV
jgi:hypothetical protein